MSWEVPSSSIFWKSLCRIGTISSLSAWWKSLVKPSGLLEVFLFGIFFMLMFLTLNLSYLIKAMQVIYFFLSERLWFMYFKEFVNFIYIIKLISINSFIMFSYYLCNVWKICSDILLINDNDTFYLLFIFINLCRGLLILLIFFFKQPAFSFIDYSPLYFSISLNSSVFIISFVLLALDLICFSFSSF